MDGLCSVGFHRTESQAPMEKLMKGRNKMRIISHHVRFTRFAITSTVEEATFDSDEAKFEVEQTCFKAEQTSFNPHDVIDESWVIAEWFATRSAPSRSRSAPPRSRSAPPQTRSRPAAAHSSAG